MTIDPVIALSLYLSKSISQNTDSSSHTTFWSTSNPRFNRPFLKILSVTIPGKTSTLLSNHNLLFQTLIHFHFYFPFLTTLRSRSTTISMYSTSGFNYIIILHCEVFHYCKYFMFIQLSCSLQFVFTIQNPLYKTRYIVVSPFLLSLRQHAEFNYYMIQISLFFYRFYTV